MEHIFTGDRLGAMALAGLVVTQVVSLARAYIARNGKGNGRSSDNAGGKDVAFWQKEQHDIVTKVLQDTVIPILDRQTLILSGVEKQIDRLAAIEEMRSRG